MTQVAFWKKKYGKVEGWWYFFDLSDLAHIHRVIRIHYGDACYQISEESVVSCWSYKVWHKLHFFLVNEKKKYAKYTGIFDFSDLAHIHRSEWK